MRVASPLRPGAVDRLAYIDAVLESGYGTPEVELGNKPDPLDEAIYIILSFQTDLARFRPAHRRRALHVNLVVHGQRTCLPREPQCSRCPLNAQCPKIGVRASRPFATSLKARAPVARTNTRG